MSEFLITPFAKTERLWRGSQCPKDTYKAVNPFIHVYGRCSSKQDHSGDEAMGFGASMHGPVQIQTAIPTTVLMAHTASPMGCH